MVVMTAKVSKAKLILAVVLVLAVVIFAAVYLSGSSDNTAEQTVSEIRTNDQRIAYLESYGWAVSEKPVETEAVFIPNEMNDVLAQYNELQKSQGFDLSDYAGKQVKRYVYEVTNYPNTDAPVFATLLIWQDTVIGGDITVSEGNGQMHGFTMPDQTEQSGQTAAQTSEEPTPEPPTV